MKVAKVSLARRRRELHLDRYHAIVFPLNDQIDLAIAGVRPQVAHARLYGLCIDPHAEGHQRLEERSEQDAVPRNRWSNLPPLEQRILVDSQQ